MEAVGRMDVAEFRVWHFDGEESVRSEKGPQPRKGGDRVGEVFQNVEQRYAVEQTGSGVKVLKEPGDNGNMENMPDVPGIALVGLKSGDIQAAATEKVGELAAAGSDIKPSAVTLERRLQPCEAVTRRTRGPNDVVRFWGEDTFVFQPVTMLVVVPKLGGGRKRIGAVKPAAGADQGCQRTTMTVHAPGDLGLRTTT